MNLKEKMVADGFHNPADWLTAAQANSLMLETAARSKQIDDYANMNQRIMCNADAIATLQAQLNRLQASQQIEENLSVDAQGKDPELLVAKPAETTVPEPKGPVNGCSCVACDNMRGMVKDGVVLLGITLNK